MADVETNATGNKTDGGSEGKRIFKGNTVLGELQHCGCEQVGHFIVLTVHIIVNEPSRTYRTLYMHMTSLFDACMYVCMYLIHACNIHTTPLFDICMYKIHACNMHKRNQHRNLSHN